MQSFPTYSVNNGADPSPSYMLYSSVGLSGAPLKFFFLFLKPSLWFWFTPWVQPLWSWWPLPIFLKFSLCPFQHMIVQFCPGSSPFCPGSSPFWGEIISCCSPIVIKILVSFWKSRYHITVLLKCSFSSGIGRRWWICLAWGWFGGGVAVLVLLQVFRTVGWCGPRWLGLSVIKWKLKNMYAGMRQEIFAKRGR